MAFDILDAGSSRQHGMTPLKGCQAENTCFLLVSIVAHSSRQKATSSLEICWTSRHHIDPREAMAIRSSSVNGKLSAWTKGSWLMIRSSVRLRSNHILQIPKEICAFLDAQSYRNVAWPPVETTLPVGLTANVGNVLLYCWMKNTKHGFFFVGAEQTISHYSWAVNPTGSVVSTGGQATFR